MPFRAAVAVALALSAAPAHADQVERWRPDPDAPRDNILAGTAYLRVMYDRFGYPGLFGAYNAGPARYAAWLEGRSRLPSETVAYLRAVSGEASAAPVRTAVRPEPPGQTMFAVERTRPAMPVVSSVEAAVSAPTDPLFAVRHDRD